MIDNLFSIFMMKEKDNIFFFLKKGKEKWWWWGMGVICHVMADDGV